MWWTKEAKYKYTPEFKNWFGDWENDPQNASQIVDEKGVPLTVYHGSYKPGFDEFGYSNHIGYHFGTPEQANKLIEDKHNWSKNFAVYPTHLNIRNPLEMDDLITWLNPYEWVQKLAERNLFDNIDEQIKFGDMLDKLFSEGRVKQWEQNQEFNPQKNVDHTPPYTDFFNYIINFIKSKGYDGMVYDNKLEGEGKSYIAFNPNQIKSAIGNKGTFNPQNPSIIE